MQEQLSGGQQLVPGLKNFALVCPDLSFLWNGKFNLSNFAEISTCGENLYECKLCYFVILRKKIIFQRFSTFAQFARVFSIKRPFLLLRKQLFAMFFNPYSVCESAADWAKLATRIRAWGVCPRLQQRVDIFFSNNWQYHSIFFKSLAIFFNFFKSLAI